MKINRNFEKRGPLYLPRYDVDPPRRFDRYKQRFRAGASLVAHTTAAGANGGTSAAVDTTGANFIAAVVAWNYGTQDPPVVSDSNLNVWTSAIESPGTAGNAKSVIFYCTPTTVGAGHTFTFVATGGAGDLFIAAFSGMATSSVLQSGKVSSAVSNVASTGQPGSITPSGPTLLIAGTVTGNGGTYAIDSSFTITDQISAGATYGGAMAYLTQASGSAINPTWSGVTTSWGMTMAAFVVAAAAAGVPWGWNSQSDQPQDRVEIIGY